MSGTAHDIVLETKKLSKCFAVGSDRGSGIKPCFLAVSDVSIQIRRGETFGIVGESGSGKSTLARLIMGLIPPSSGEIWFEGQRVDNLSEAKRRPIRPKCQMVFQDSGSSLNPRKRVSDILTEPMRFHRVAEGKALDRRVDELLNMVGLHESAKDRFPHEFSGGQRQRICIARALSLNPDLIVLDEPVSALDVSVQAQILNLLRDLQQQLGLTYVFIAHGLGSVHYVSHRIAVMYTGSVVEYGDSDELFDLPAHPYTRALLDAAPVADYDLRGRERMLLRGEVESIPQTGCVLQDRCPYVTDSCRVITPALAPLPGYPGRFAACDRALKPVPGKGDA